MPLVKVKQEWLRCKVCGAPSTHYDDYSHSDVERVRLTWTGFYCDTHGERIHSGRRTDLVIEEEFQNKG